VIRTRVGYAGGTKSDPTYRDLGNHSETIQIDYDPDRISYQDLLEVFWNSHSPSSRPWSRQYASLIFYHEEEQRRLAEETRAREAAEHGSQIYTEIVPFSRFYLAEDYHQKYRLQQVPELLAVVRTAYPMHEDLVNSTLAARLNGVAGGYGTVEALRAEIETLDLPPAAVDQIRAALEEWER
jgi:peptide-methionine (S)-S-oxide reductase